MCSLLEIFSTGSLLGWKIMTNSFSWSQWSWLDMLKPCVANLFGRASPGKENLVLSHSETGLNLAQQKFVLLWPDACPTKFAIPGCDNIMWRIFALCFKQKNSCLLRLQLGLELCASTAKCHCFRRSHCSFGHALLVSLLLAGSYTMLASLYHISIM